jgi:cyclophilin family peptidyl-prolyl cis-trans isomerase
MKECPFCGAEVNKENLEKHFLKVHKDLKKKSQDEGKTVIRKRKPKKKDRISTVISVMALVIIVILIGVVAYRTLNQDTGGNGTGNGSSGGKPVATMSTSMGTIKIELDRDKAPITAGNFIDLAKSGFYNGLNFHRVVPGFVIQGGGFRNDGSQKESGSISWEGTGLQNLRYTISMARSGDANNQADSGTATSQFFINLADNSNLDDPTYPYVVFGRITGGQDIVDKIGALSTGTYYGMSDWPDNPPVINSVTIS